MSMASIGWRLTTDIIAVICILFAIVYYLLGGGYEAFSKTIENFKTKDDDIMEPLITDVDMNKSKNPRPSKLKVDIDNRSFQTYYESSIGFRVPKTPSCFLGGYGRMLQEPST